MKFDVVFHSGVRLWKIRLSSLEGVVKLSSITKTLMSEVFWSNWISKRMGVLWNFVHMWKKIDGVDYVYKANGVGWTGCWAGFVYAMNKSNTL
jgi:hypothetical protein